LNRLARDAVFRVRCDIEAILRVKQILVASGCEIERQEFAPADRMFILIARKTA